MPVNPIKADPESFVHRVRDNYDVRDKDAIEKRLAEDRKAMQDDEDFSNWGYPPGVYWKRRDQEERAKEMVRDQDAEKTTDILVKSSKCRSGGYEDALDHWLQRPDPECLNEVEHLTGNERKKAFHALADRTEHKNGKFLLYRGVERGFDRTHRSAWTASRKVAEHFARDREKDGVILSAWVPENDIVTVPFYVYPKHPGADELEVIVEKGVTFKIDNSKTVDAYPPAGRSK